MQLVYLKIIEPLFPIYTSGLSMTLLCFPWLYLGNPPINAGGIFYCSSESGNTEIYLIDALRGQHNVRDGRKKKAVSISQ